MIKGMLNRLEELIDDLHCARLKVDSVLNEMIVVKDNLIIETEFKEEYLLYEECPIEHNDITYRAWRDDLIKRFNVIFEGEYMCKKNNDDFYECQRVERLEDLFEIYKLASK